MQFDYRAKKQKNIYDPSENNGPVHKKKKEAHEAALMLEEAKKKQSTTPGKASKTKTPSKTKIQAIKSTTALPKTPLDVRKKLVMDKVETAKPVATGTLKVANKPVPRREPETVQYDIIEETDGGTSSSANSEFEKASTIEIGVNKKKIPDVSKWTPQDVYNYFVSQGFDKKEVAKLQHEEIDGETLMLMNRDDMKNLQLKVGTFVKMWNRVVSIQSKRIDFTQGWK